ncbi:hypothetical protein BZG36_04274 [Bifiguratus adelaidae]|uniref:HMG box domain-containing protein n=1 Tax=Bifiguratus adelaidae TaxID=1938954 RepID=A0A261XWS2_9FUNG|nr:hypothetical protein BZG36_04274 [Bifiguratus adelaidae]
MTTPDVDARYRKKYKELKRRIRDIEEENDALNLKLHKARRSLQRLKVERHFLFERLEQERGDKSDVSSLSSDDLDHPDSELSDRETSRRKKTQRKKRDPNAPKRPGNVFFLYCRLERDKIKDKHPTEQHLDKYYDLYQKEQDDYKKALKSYADVKKENGHLAASMAPPSQEREDETGSEMDSQLFEDEYASYGLEREDDVDELQDMEEAPETGEPSGPQPEA